MLLISAVCRLLEGPRIRRGEAAWRQPPPFARFLNNVVDLSVPPRGMVAFAARCLLLLAVVVLCYHLGAGAAIFLRTAPLPAMIIGGALFAATVSGWWRRD